MAVYSAQLVAQFDTTFSLPVISPSLKLRYERLGQDQERLQQQEDRYSQLSVQDEARNVQATALRERRDFLTKLVAAIKRGQALKRGWIQTDRHMEARARDQIADLESKIERSQHAVRALEEAIKQEETSLDARRQQGTVLGDSTKELERVHAQIEEETDNVAKKIAKNDRFIQEKQTHYFKMLDHLYQLQRSINALDVQSLLDPDKQSSADPTKVMSKCHQISHILDRMGREQTKFLVLSKTSLPSDEDSQAEGLSAETRDWMERELGQNMSENRDLKLKNERIMDAVLDLKKSFIAKVNSANELLEEYAAVESKNMAIQLRTTRMAIMGKVARLEPEYPMYQKYNQILDAAQKAAITADNPREDGMDKLYLRKELKRENAIKEAQAVEAKLDAIKRSILDSSDKHTDTYSQIVDTGPSSVQIHFEKLSLSELHQQLNIVLLKHLDDSALSTAYPQVSYASAKRLLEFFKAMSTSRQGLFEKHLTKCLSISDADLRLLVDDIANLANTVALLTKKARDHSVKVQTESETIHKMEVQLQQLKTAKQEEQTLFESKNAQLAEIWLKNASEIEENLIREKLRLDESRTVKTTILDSIRQAKIDLINLQHRHNVFKGVKRNHQQLFKDAKSLTSHVETEKAKTNELQNELQNMHNFYQQAKSQQNNLENLLAKNAFQKIIKNKEILEAQRTQLIQEQNHLQQLVKNYNILPSSTT